MDGYHKNVPMSIPVVVDVHAAVLRQQGYHDVHEWLQNSQHVYIGRSMLINGKRIPASPWANPFKGDDKQQCVQQYYQHVCHHWSYYGPMISQLKGKILGCWCVGSPNEPTGAVCHGHVLQYIYQQTQPQ